jgi:hypothetical protein
MKKILTKQDVKKNVFPHTQAKLDLFKGYLEHYLRILCYADFCKQINLYDIYCGAGLYEDGKKGSPLLALDCIRNINEEILTNSKKTKLISLTVNDYDPRKIENVRNNADTHGVENCSIEYYNKENKPHYENLRKFLMSFFGENQQPSNKTIFEYIRSIKEALSINNKYYTCSHYIEREKGSYYALFFIGSNIYGLEKMIETKWKLDPVKGKGFNQKKSPNLFDDEFEEFDNMREIVYLENAIYKSIERNGKQTNCDIYALTLHHEFLPKHANDVLKNLIKQGKIQELNKSVGYGINYQNFKRKYVTSIFVKL